MKRKKNRAMTLMEVMIVIVIIGIIGSVIGYNMKGGLNQGRAFKTKEGINKLYHIVNLYIENDELKALEDKKEELAKKAEKILMGSGLVTKPKEYLSDGWKIPLTFKIIEVKKGNGIYEMRMTSSKYEAYCEKMGRKTDYPWETD